MMPGPTAPKPQAAGTSSFGNLLNEAIQQVNDVEKGSQGELQKFLSNESDLHSVMIALEKADLSFQVMMQVRNKIVQAYQEIMKSQV
jgi:flagellar hook-basal body complex protein FliE